MNLDFLKIHLSITLGRINIFTSSFFLGFSLSKALHLTPKMLKSEIFLPYKGGLVVFGGSGAPLFFCPILLKIVQDDPHNQPNTSLNG